MTTQQVFLRAAMAELAMTRAVFAKRLGCPVKTLNNWLLPATSGEGRQMPETVWTLVREILAHEALKNKCKIPTNGKKNT